MPRLLKSPEDYQRALSRVSGLMDAVPGTAELDELELFSALVDLYESEHFAIDAPSPVEAIRFRMEQGGLSQQDLVPFIGSRSKVSEILSGI